jgi:hypothetical protein
LKLDKIIDAVIGTAASVEEVAAQHGIDWGQLSTAELNYFDSYVFMCESCGWWCGTDEMSEEQDGVCDECHE